VPQTRAGIDELVRRTSAGHEGACEFVMEPTGLAWLPLAAELSRQGHKVYKPKPQKTHALRKFLAQHAKTDAIDACAAALVRQVDKEKTHELRVPTATETTLRLVVKQRARLVVEAAKAKARIQSYLVLANPHLGKALGRERSSEVATAFLRRQLDPFEVVALGKAELRGFWDRHSHGGLDDDQLDAVWNACVTTRDLYAALRDGKRLPFDYASLQLLVRQGLEHIEFLEGQLDELDAVVARSYATLDPERFLERQVCGFGPTIAATVQAFAGDVERFGSVKRYAAFFGIIPRTKQTGAGGEKPGQRMTKGGNNLLKQYMFLAAETARRHDPEAPLLRGRHRRAPARAPRLRPAQGARRGPCCRGRCAQLPPAEPGRPRAGEDRGTQVRRQALPQQGRQGRGQAGRASRAADEDIASGYGVVQRRHQGGHGCAARCGITRILRL
jgi:transposase